MENKHMPAFPISEEATDRIKAGIEIYIGVTKLEFIACNAPVDIPGWFVHTPPDMEVTKRPTCDGMKEADIQLILCWHDCGADALGDGLPDNLKWYAVQFTLHNKEQAEYNQLNQQERYFQWRKFYAEQLLLTLEA